MNSKKLLAFLVLLMTMALIAIGCGGGEPEQVEVTRVVTEEVQTEVTRVVTEEVPVEVTRVVEVTPAGPVGEPEPAEEAKPAVEVPFLEAWSGSGHNDTEAEAFNHWNEDDPQEVPTSCARCHSTPGYRDYLGADGTEARVVDNAAPIGTTVECVACHNEVTIDLHSVVFPSGVELTGLGDESRCMVCHQGRASTSDVNNAIEEVGVDLDTVSEDLGFINIHYFAAAATQYGGEAHGGYEYDGKPYDVKFEHVAGYDACQKCHNQHTLEIRLEECQQCHEVESREDLINIRMNGSLADYDGDGDLEEGVMSEIQGVQEMLYSAIQAYGNEVSGTAIVYDAHSYPYFFVDTNGNGEPDEDEANYGNRYNAWTPRLLKAAYNYQTSQKDPGEFAHGGKYIIQLLYDSTEDLNAALAEPVDLSSAHRIDPGHFAGSEEAFRHWDEDGEVSASCAKCHSAEGLPFLLENGVSVSQELSNGLACTTCHSSMGEEFARHTVNEVEFPSGAVLSFGEENDSNLCLMCHQGRESTVSVRELTDGLDPDAVSEDVRFLNIHYFAAGATLFGTDAKGGYEYEGQEYVGRFTHVRSARECIQCHSTHALEIKIETCTDALCHANVEKTEEGLRDIRATEDVDFDGDGDSTEGLAYEVETLYAALYGAIQDYAANVAGNPIVYDPHSYPYFFNDTNGNGEPDEDEANYGNRYNTWTPRLLKAAYNYQYVTKDPGGFAHNGLYIIQMLYDSLADLGTQADVDMTGMVRP